MNTTTSEQAQCNECTQCTIVPVLWRYLPVRTLDLLGQQMGVVANALVNSAPLSAISSLAALRGVVPPMVTSWSSVKITTMLGLLWLPVTHITLKTR